MAHFCWEMGTRLVCPLLTYMHSHYQKTNKDIITLVNALMRRNSKKSAKCRSRSLDLLLQNF